MTNPLVSVITPCFNGEKYVDAFLTSILKQTYSNLELIFVNDGSADRTEQIALSYKEKFENRGIRFIYIYQENSGQAAAINRGLKIFSGDYLTWPDSDDILTEDSIQVRVAFLERSPDYMLVRSNGLYVEENTLARLCRISDKPNRFNEYIMEDLFLDRTYCSCGCYMVRKEAFFQIYPQRQIFESREGQNWQLLVPISSISKCRYLDEDLYWVVRRADSHCRRPRSFADQMKRIDGMEEILIHAFQVSSCNFDECMKKVHVKHARMRLCLAAKEHKMDILDRQYIYLKDNRGLSAADRLLYFKGRHVLAGHIYERIMTPVRFLLKGR